MKNHCKDNHFYVIKHSFRAQIPKFNIFYYLRGGWLGGFLPRILRIKRICCGVEVGQPSSTGIKKYAK